jgi:hypothetical protein
MCDFGEAAWLKLRNCAGPMLLSNSPNKELMRFTRLNIKSLRG